MKSNIIILLTILLASCGNKGNESDAYGNFEATSAIISAESNGKILYLNVEEGETIESGKLVAILDTTQLHLQRLKLEASIGTISKKLRNTLAEIAVLQNQKANMVREKDRINRLVLKKAATQKNLDDIEGQISVINKKIEALRTQTNTVNTGILAEKEPLLAQMNILNQQIKNSYVYNPFKGTVLSKFAETHELGMAGKPLYKIGSLDTLTLRFYVDALQLQELKLNQVITVLVDEGEKGYRELNGSISWISSKAEFTPKTIQTKEDRVTLVYAIKAKVVNDGFLKIGMPAEVVFATHK
jgi:HlyD family secretion protein